MTDTSMTPETPGIAETAHFLRRFADMMSVGQNATYLHHAAILLEDLTARLTAALDEEQLWRYKYETVAHQADAVESESEALKHDIDGHLDIISSTIAERDTLKATLQACRSELSELRRDAAAKSEAHQNAMAGLRSAFDREREALNAAAVAREAELSGLRLDHGRERDDLAVRLKVSGDELAALRVVSEREREALMAKVTGLEARRAELRSAFDRIGDLRNQTARQGGAERFMAETSGSEAELGSSPPLAVGETDVMVPRATLRQVRSQFEYLANEFTGTGDVASQVMCELGAFTMELALGAGRKADPLPVGEVALSILASPGSTAVAGAGTG